MPYVRRPFNPLVPAPNQVVNELNQANENFDILAQAFVGNNPETFKVKEALNSDNSQNAVNSQNADTVDGFHASLTPAPNTIVPLNAGGILDLSATYVKSNVYTFRKVNLTGATSDYMLQVGEEAIINFTNATSVPLRIATQSGTYYVVHLICSNTGGTSGANSNYIFLNPNNTTYSFQFWYADMYVYWYYDPDYGPAAWSSASYTTFSSFRIGYAFSNCTFYITNYTQYKNVRGFCDVYGINSINTYPNIFIFSTDWRNTTTAWTSLGTITFPQQTSGYILVRRLA